MLCVKENTVNKVSSAGRAAHFLGEEKELLQILYDLFTQQKCISYSGSFVPGVRDFCSPLFIPMAYYSARPQMCLGMFSLNNALSLLLCLQQRFTSLAIMSRNLSSPEKSLSILQRVCA